MINSHRIDIERISLGQRGHLYRVHHAGAVLIPSSRNPEFDACRELLLKGFSGQLECFHVGAECPALRLDIAKGARLTVEDSDRVGPRFARWRPRSEEATDAVSCSGASPRTAENEIQVGGWPPQKDRPESRPARGTYHLGGHDHG